MDLAVVVGNPKEDSRTLAIALALSDAITKKTGAERVLTIDLAKHAGELFEWPNATLAAFNDRVAACDLAIIATPTYKASYTGLLKAFLDRYPNEGLAGVLAIPVMTGGSSAHSMGVDAHLRPLLLELGAITPTTSLYFVMDQMGNLGAVIDDWMAKNDRVLSAMTGLPPRPPQPEEPAGKESS